MIVGYEDQKSWLVWDSYPESEGDFIKELEWDYNFGQAKIAYLEKKEISIEQISIFQKILDLMVKILSFQWLITEKKMEDKAKTILQPTSPQTPEISPVDEIKDNLPTNEEKPATSPNLAKWSYPEGARHEIRVICDEMGLSYAEKNLLCAVIQAESQFDIIAIHKDLNGSTDYSLCQYNDRYWIGEDKPFSSPQDVFNNPERQVRIMLNEYKKGNLKWRVAYKTGLYKKYLMNV